MTRLTPILVAAVLSLVLFAGVAHAQEDLTPPTLLEVSFDPSVIDTTKGPVTVTVTIHITDDLSGMRHAALFFDKPGTTQHAQVEFRPDEGWSQLISGDLRDGYQQATMTLPQYSAYGEWEMKSLVLEDKVGNRTDVTRPEDENDGDLGRGDNSWPSLYNGFGFQVGQAAAPVFDTFMFLPSLSVQ